MNAEITQEITEHMVAFLGVIRKLLNGYFMIINRSSVMKQRKKTPASDEMVDKTPDKVHQELALQLSSMKMYLKKKNTICQ
jgi:uncharacterized protein (UPF0262 family)